MVATPVQMDVRLTTPDAAIDELAPLVSIAVGLAQLREQGTLSEEELEAGLSILFREAQDVRAPQATEYHRVYLDWTNDPIEVELGGPSQRYEAPYARVDRRLQPYFGYGWEYSGGSAQQAVRFDERDAEGAESNTGGLVTVKGAWVDLTR